MDFCPAWRPFPKCKDVPRQPQHRWLFLRHRNVVVRNEQGARSDGAKSVGGGKVWTYGKYYVGVEVL